MILFQIDFYKIEKSQSAKKAKLPHKKIPFESIERDFLYNCFFSYILS